MISTHKSDVIKTTAKGITELGLSDRVHQSV